MEPSISRRRFLQLSTITAIPSAGCLGFQDDLPDLKIYNRLSESITVTTTVTRMTDNQQLFKDTTTVPNNGSHPYDDPIKEPGAYQIQVSVEGGNEDSYEWEAPADEGVGLHIRINTNNIEIVQVTAE